MVQTDEYVQVTLLQALAGDTNGDRIVDIPNDGSAFVLNLGTQVGMDWPDGDFNQDGGVDIANDGSALVLNLGKFYKGEGKDVSPGEASGVVDLADGSIFLEMDSVMLYSVYVGVDDPLAIIKHTDALVFDEGVEEPEWVYFRSGHENNVDSPEKESFGELDLGGNFLTMPSYDTKVNVNFDGFGDEATTIWLKYQLYQQPAETMVLYRVPEPGTLAMLLGTGLLGLLMLTIRRRRAA